MPDIRIDRSLCTGAGVCIVYAPDTFDHDAQSKAVLRREPADPLESVQAAIEGCPTGALQLISHDEEP